MKKRKSVGGGGPSSLISPYLELNSTLSDRPSRDTRDSVDSILGSRESVISSTEFDFDNILLKTKPYRGPLARRALEDPSSSKQELGLPQSKKTMTSMVELNKPVKVEKCSVKDTVNGLELRPYWNVSVLMLSWSISDIIHPHPNSRRELVEEQETNELSAVFQNEYGFEVEKARLHGIGLVKQLRKHVLRFLTDHDDENALLIIYYAGNGFSPGLHSVLPEDIAWNSVETLLSSGESDVIVIFDCCSAGSLCRSVGIPTGLREQSEPPTRFEYLGACKAGQTTREIGPYSFTAALIWALKRLLYKRYFSTTDLQMEIKKAPFLPKGQDPVLTQRFLPTRDSIILGPLRNNGPPNNCSISLVSDDEWMTART